MLKLNPGVSSVQLNLFADIQTLYEQLQATVGTNRTEIKTEADFHALIGKMVVNTANPNRWSDFAQEVQALMGTAYVHNAALPPTQRFHLDWWNAVSQKLLQLLAFVIAVQFKSRSVVSLSTFWAIDQCFASLTSSAAMYQLQDQMVAKINTFLNTPHT